MAPTTRAADQAAKIEEKVKVTLYWLEKSRAHRILWLLEELKIDYELKTYKRQDMRAPDDFKKVHPLGKAPLVTVEKDGMDKPTVLAESGLIIEYLIDNFGPWLVPSKYKEGKESQVCGESEEWLRYRYYMHYGEGSLMPLTVTSILVGLLRTQPPFFLRPITSVIAGSIESKFLGPEFKMNHEFLEEQMSTSPEGGDYLCGKNLSGADFMMIFPLQVERSRAVMTTEKYPKLNAYVERLEARDAYKRAVQKIINSEGSFQDGI